MTAFHHDETNFSVNLNAVPTLVITDDNGTRKIHLTADKYTIGRQTDNLLRLNSDFVSRYHAILLKVHRSNQAASYQIIDGSSSGKLSKNGIFLNGVKKVSSHELQDGDIITFAPKVHILYLAPKLT
ncbi:MAG: FHA domain-containing protein [Pseudanabaena sp.]